MVPGGTSSTLESVGNIGSLTAPENSTAVSHPTTLTVAAERRRVPCEGDENQEDRDSQEDGGPEETHD